MKMEGNFPSKYSLNCKAAVDGNPRVKINTIINIMESIIFFIFILLLIL